MPTPSGGYWLEPEHERVPGVTTILSRFKESGGLIHWAWKLGMEGKDYREVRDEAAGIGTLAHAMVDAHIRKTEAVSLAGYSREQIKAAFNSFGAYKEWAAAYKFEVTDTEQQMVSRIWRFGGTPDGCLLSGRRVMSDVKTSSALYAEYLCQLAAYRELWNENHPDDQCAPGGHLLRFDKTNGDFSHHFYSDLDDAWEAFKHMRSLYGLMRYLEKRVK